LDGRRLREGSAPSEEKILALQDKKAAFAARVLAEDGEALAKFSEADIRALLELLPER